MLLVQSNTKAVYFTPNIQRNLFPSLFSTGQCRGRYYLENTNKQEWESSLNHSGVVLKLKSSYTGAMSPHSCGMHSSSIYAQHVSENNTNACNDFLETTCWKAEHRGNHMLLCCVRQSRVHFIIGSAGHC